MTSFINTMYVQPSHFRFRPPSPRPLPAQHSNVLVGSKSLIHLQETESPRQTPGSPPQRQVLSAWASDDDLWEPSRTSGSAHDRGPRAHGLGSGLEGLLVEAGFLTLNDSNARSRQGGAFQPQKRAKGTNSWQLKQFAEATLGSGSLRKVVQLPEGEDRDEWLAVNVVDFYNQINLLYGAITEFCSPQTCPEMKATDEFEYLWQDPPAFPKPTRLPAPTYISHLLTWTSNHLSDPAVFPTQPGVPFPPTFAATIRNIFKRLYRIYAHIYCHHYPVVRGLGLEAHLNTGFKHYVLFVEEFGLADDRGGRRGEWFGPLGDLVESMLRSE